MNEPILTARGLTKEFQGFVAVNNLDLTVREGAVHAIIGPNGAGKSTLFNLLTKFLVPTAGSIHYRGRDITRLASADIACMGMIRSFQISAVFPEASVLENVRLALQRRAGLSRKVWRSERILHALDAEAAELIEQGGISDHIDDKAANLSYGRKRILELMTTLALAPDVMLLDEPMAGMGAEDIARVTGLIRTAAKGRTVVMVEHNLSVVEDLCDVVTVLQRGEVLAEGNYETVSADARVREAYMGAGHE